MSSAIRIKITYTAEYGVPANCVKHQNGIDIRPFIVKKFLNSGKYYILLSSVCIVTAGRKNYMAKRKNGKVDGLYMVIFFYPNLKIRHVRISILFGTFRASTFNVYLIFLWRSFFVWSPKIYEFFDFPVISFVVHSDSFQRNSKQFSFFNDIDKYYDQNFNVKKSLEERVALNVDQKLSDERSI